MQADPSACRATASICLAASRTISSSTEQLASLGSASSWTTLSMGVPSRPARQRRHMIRLAMGYRSSSGRCAPSRHPAEDHPQVLIITHEIYVLNLHGNSKKKERAPKDGKDENVFDIQQGVAIGIFVRLQREQSADRGASVYYADLWGQRGAKYTWLAAQDITTTHWTSLAPDRPFYLFRTRDVSLHDEYASERAVNEML